MVTLQAFVVGKDFGAKTAFDLAIQHPDRVMGIVTVGVPFAPRPFAAVCEPLKGSYIARWRVIIHHYTSKFLNLSLNSVRQKIML